MSPPEAVDPDLAAMLATCTVCRPWAEQDEGPYHRDAQPVRRDLVENCKGVSLQLGIRLAERGGAPSDGAVVEVWQCDALGRYSGFPPPDDAAVVTADSAPRTEYLPDQTFLRGRQHADPSGMVQFETIFPGWYPGRTVHIHVMVHLGKAVFTSQLYFPDAITDEVLSHAPYAQRPGRDTTNDSDKIFPTGGEPAVVDVTSTDHGYRAAICLVLPEGATA